MREAQILQHSEESRCRLQLSMFGEAFLFALYIFLVQLYSFLPITLLPMFWFISPEGCLMNCVLPTVRPSKDVHNYRLFFSSLSKYSQHFSIHQACTISLIVNVCCHRQFLLLCMSESSAFTTSFQGLFCSRSLKERPWEQRWSHDNWSERVKGRKTKTLELTLDVLCKFCF